MIRSARRWIGAFEPCARWTSSTIRARAVSRPTRVARMTNEPVVLSVAADDLVAGAASSTGIGSPVSIDSSTALDALDEHAVDRDLVAGPDAQQVARHDDRQLDVLLDAVAQPPGGRRLEPDEAPDRAGRAALRAGLEPPAEQDQADDDRRAVEVRLGVEARLVDHLGPHRDEHGVAPRRRSSRARPACPSSCRRAAPARHAAR